MSSIISKDHCKQLHSSPAVKKTRARRVVLDKWLPLRCAGSWSVHPYRSANEPRGAACGRGWQNTVGNLIEICWLKKTYRRPEFIGIRVNHRGVRFHRIRDCIRYYFNSIPPTFHGGRGAVAVAPCGRDIMLYHNHMCIHNYMCVYLYVYIYIYIHTHT